MLAQHSTVSYNNMGGCVRLPQFIKTSHALVFPWYDDWTVVATEKKLDNPAFLQLRPREIFVNSPIHAAYFSIIHTPNRYF